MPTWTAQYMNRWCWRPESEVDKWQYVTDKLIPVTEEHNALILYTPVDNQRNTNSLVVYVTWHYCTADGPMTKIRDRRTAETRNTNWTWPFPERRRWAMKNLNWSAQGGGHAPGKQRAVDAAISSRSPGGQISIPPTVNGGAQHSLCSCYGDVRCRRT